VVASGQHVRAQVKQVVGNLRSHAEAAGRVFGIHDDQIDGIGRDHVPDVLMHNLAARAPKDVTHKKNVQQTAPGCKS